MSQELKSQLFAVVRERAQHGQGAFQRRLAQSGASPIRMTNGELSRELEHAYGEAVLRLLDEAGVQRFYETDLISTLGAERARLVLKHRRRPVIQPPAPASQPDRPRRQTRRLGAWSSGAIGVAAFMFFRAFVVGTDGEAAVTAGEMGASANEIVTSEADDEPYEFGSCAQYLGAVSGLRCFRQVGGERAPAHSPDSEAARQEMAQAIRASRWRRHSQCSLFLPQVDGVSFHAGSMAFVELRNSGRLTQERVYDACSSSANRAAYEACSSASGMCEAGY